MGEWVCYIVLISGWMRVMGIDIRSKEEAVWKPQYSPIGYHTDEHEVFLSKYFQPAILLEGSKRACYEVGNWWDTIGPYPRAELCWIVLRINASISQACPESVDFSTTDFMMAGRPSILNMFNISIQIQSPMTVWRLLPSANCKSV